MSIFEISKTKVGGSCISIHYDTYHDQVLRPLLRAPRDQMVDQAVATILEKIDTLAEEAEEGEAPWKLTLDLAIEESPCDALPDADAVMRLKCSVALILPDSLPD